MGRGQNRSAVPGEARLSLFLSLSVLELINSAGKAQPCPGGEFVTEHGLQEAWGDVFGTDKYIWGRARGCAPCPAVAPLSSRRQGHPPGWLWPAQLQVLTFGVPGADRIPDTLELPRRASFAASPTGLGVRFSFVASGISASLWLFLCLSCFTWPGGLGFSDF